jgi:hypothetical protein
MSFKTPLSTLSLFALLAGVPAVVTGQSAPRDRAALVEFFEKRVRPVLVDNCYTCHSANTNSKGGLRVDDRNGLIQGGVTGSAVVPGEPEKSLLVQAIGYQDEDLKMPPKKRLSAEQVRDLTQWIKDGAAWPEVGVPVATNKNHAKYDRLRKEHWAWQPLKETRAPEVRDASWVRDDIDRFVLSKLETKGLRPVGDSDKRSLIRRVTFDLTGLPPTPEEIEAFVSETSTDGLDKVVDRLLTSPAFGERWGRHWLDVARFGESTGSSRNLPFPHAWRYRDYVIDAFTHDKPFDQFVREQIAGDLLPASSQRERDEHLIATGFLAVGVKDVNQRFKVRFIMDNVDEQIDTVSRSVLAITASCARCHDHKFDPIPTTDYYALAGIFRSSDMCAGLRNKMGGGGLDYYDSQMLLRVGPENTAKTEETARKIEETKKDLAKARAENARQRMTKLQNELIELSDPVANGDKVAMGVRDSKTVSDTEIRIRGEAEKLGPVVPRGFLTVLPFAGQPKVNPTQSGRLELAQWLTSEKNPLTPRVMANRVWRHLFGQGLVRSVDNFGVMGDVPSHPELLDHLATWFEHNGWSTKKLVRKIVLSRAYRLSAETSPANFAVDPANRLVWRHNPRRLDAEEIRDAALAAAGNLDLARPEGSPEKDMKVIELANDGAIARRLAEQAGSSTHRSLYLPLLRGLTPTSLEVFDFAEQGMVTGSRDTTTVATQALYLLNDPFVRRQSLALAERLLERTGLDDAGRVDRAYQLTVGRPATTEEVRRANNYLAQYESAVSAVVASTPVVAKPRPIRVVALGGAGQDGRNATSAPATAAVQKSAPPKKGPEEGIRPRDSKTAAWASFCQALLGSAEFRYIR